MDATGHTNGQSDVLVFIYSFISKIVPEVLSFSFHGERWKKEYVNIFVWYTGMNPEGNFHCHFYNSLSHFPSFVNFWNYSSKKFLVLLFQNTTNQVKIKFSIMCVIVFLMSLQQPELLILSNIQSTSLQFRSNKISFSKRQVAKMKY